MTKADIVIIGAGPGGMQASIDLARHDIDVILIDKSLGKPEAPDGCVTIARKSYILGNGHCGTPSGIPDWSKEAECDIYTVTMASRNVKSALESEEVLGYNFTREKFWNLMLDAAMNLGATAIETEVIKGEVRNDGVTLETSDGSIEAKAVIYAGGVRSNPELPRSLGLGVPPTVHGLFGIFDYDAEWNEPYINILWNQDIAPQGYFWCGVMPKSKKISIGIMNETPVKEAWIYQYLQSKVLPILKEIAPEKLELQRGELGAVSHLSSNHWPVKHARSRVLGIGEGIGAISCYVYSGIFESRYQGQIAAQVLRGIKMDGAWDNAARYQQFESEWQPLNHNILRDTRKNHNASYHHGSNSVLITNGYCKALKQKNSAAVESLLGSYLYFESMASKYELALFNAIQSNIPLMNKIPVTANLLQAKMQK
ncbi:MAG: NAD(P)/FAD-dependent oxidoreductase [Candidatus Hodarchaeota archaeon]